MSSVNSEIVGSEANKVRQVVVDILTEVAPDEDISCLKNEVALRDQMDLDSMDFLDIVMELKKRHSIVVPQEDYPRLESLNSCVEYLSPKFLN
ncbi:MAG: acyl carrier protein [Bdellovibrionales bacterium]|jgi:acyl carrier protein|nr:acyl carrier protein [Bdellovibrionales bacterium]MBT3525266.1 acyl carrier protein [Bdellovibrionales bacterium]MBT7668272.1 acyl carrier protein [Bdellovibrionales bacterium]